MTKVTSRNNWVTGLVGIHERRDFGKLQRWSEKSKAVMIVRCKMNEEILKIPQTICFNVFLAFLELRDCYIGLFILHVVLIFLIDSCIYWIRKIQFCTNILYAVDMGWVRCWFFHCIWLILVCPWIIQVVEFSGPCSVMFFQCFSISIIRLHTMAMFYPSTDGKVRLQ